MQMKSGSHPSSRRGVFLLAALLVSSALLGGLYGPALRATGARSGETQESVKSLARVLAIVQRNYATPVDTEKAVYDGAIPSMLRVLDPHSNFFDPHQYALLKEEQQGRYYGIGASVASRENHTVIVAPFVGSPAYKAGIRPGDIILKVDGKSCDGLSTIDVAGLLKGPQGTTVHVSLGREGWDQPIEVTIERGEISRPGVDFYSLARPGIGYVHVASFNETTDSELAQALDLLDASRLDGFILDLRSNPGGLLNQGVGVADVFLDKNELVVSHRGRASSNRPYYSSRAQSKLHVPLVVLINGESASASEIVAGALQDHDRGLIVGETSFGKALVQTQYQLSEDTALLLTTAKYYTPSGRLIQRDYKTVSLYDYHYNPKPPSRPEVKLTDSGRQVFGGGGITPDVVSPMPKPSPFQELLLRRGVFFPIEAGVGDFTRYFLAQKPEVTADFAPGDAVLDLFRRYLTKEHIRYTEPQIQENLSWIQWKIKREVITSVFGLDEGYKIELQQDPQVQRAIELMPQARALYENARRIMAEHRSPSPQTARP
jgi:carboxyl-terminal processing protease